jgi:CRISPR-associated protein Cmr4
VVTRPYLIHCLSPVHVGAGSGSGAIDLPILRMAGTGIPIVPGSSLKGVLRQAALGSGGNEEELRAAIFGPIDARTDHAGALVVGDARLLALPVRSLGNAFCWVSSPLLLQLALRDLGQGFDLEVPQPDAHTGLYSDQPGCVLTGGAGGAERAYLEELDLTVKKDDRVKGWQQLLGKRLGIEGLIDKRFLIVDDDTMAFLWQTATQVDYRVRIDPVSGTVQEGALWIEESLPPETVLVGLAAAEGSRRPGLNLTPEQALEEVFGGPRYLQVGGDATVGRGRIRLVPLRGKHDGDPR